MSAYKSARRQGDTKLPRTKANRPEKTCKRKLQTEDKAIDKALKFTLEAATQRFWPGANGKKIFMPWKREELVSDLMPKHIVHSNSALAGVDQDKVVNDGIDVMVQRGHLTVTESGLYRLNENLLMQVS